MNDQAEEPGHTTGPIGMSRPEEAVYLGLCRSGTTSVADLAQLLALDSESVLRALLGLRIRGLVRGPEVMESDVWTPVAPDLALERVLAQRERSERTAREEMTRLLDGYHRERGRLDPQTAGLVEVVTGREAIAEVWYSLQSGARESVDVFDKAPWVQGEEIEAPDPEIEMLGRGVKARGVYERASLLLPGMLEQAQALIAAGEQAAMVPELPFKLAIVDRRRALLPLAQGTELTAALIVRPSPLLDALIEVFEAQWARAMPVPRTAPRLGGRSSSAESDEGAGGAEPSGEAAVITRSASEELLTMLAAGMTDEAIARQVGVSARTVQRRISELMETLGSRNRFQAGVQAVRHGLL